MGYYAIPFSIRIEDVVEVLGSKDEKILRIIKDTSLYDNYVDQFTTLDQSLEDLIFHYRRPEDRKIYREKGFLFFKGKEKMQGCGLEGADSYIYGYALILICDALGKQIPDSDIFYASGREWKEANKILLQNKFPVTLDRMWETYCPFDLPEFNDFPAISYYSKPEIDLLISQFDRLSLPSQNDENKEVIELLNIFHQGLIFCKDRQTEWVSFLH